MRIVDIFRRKIFVYYWLGYNIGDSLSPFIIEKLSNSRIIYYDTTLKYTFRSYIKQLIILSFTLSLRKLYLLLHYFSKKILAVGSILEQSNKFSYIWGSGFISSDGKCSLKKICAVRGEYTANRLSKLGYEKPNVYGDPALLLPLIIEKSDNKLYDVAIVPHWSEISFYDDFRSFAKIIDTRTNDINDFVSQITSCKCILSSSLHGLIIAHAYGIPAILLKRRTEKEYGFFKYYDYFSSVGINNYEGFSVSVKSFDIDLKTIFNDNEDKSLPHYDIKKIQINLLKTAPFKLKSKYIDLLCNQD